MPWTSWPFMQGIFILSYRWESGSSENKLEKYRPFPLCSKAASLSSPVRPRGCCLLHTGRCGVWRVLLLLLLLCSELWEVRRPCWTPGLPPDDSCSPSLWQGYPDPGAWAVLALLAGRQLPLLPGGPLSALSRARSQLRKENMESHRNQGSSTVFRSA